MRLRFHLLLVGVVLFPAFNGSGTRAQTPGAADETPGPPPKGGDEAIQTSLGLARQAIASLQAEAAAAQDKTEIERLRKLVELQQDQLKNLEKTIRVLDELTKKELQARAAALEARSRQAAQRDQELAYAIDDLREQQDAARRNGPPLPATLRELFLPTRTNESPLAFYGTMAATYTSFEDTVSNFAAPVFSPHFYLLLNERFLLEVNPEFTGTSVELESAQIDCFLTDHLTLVLGRYYSPLGWFNERLHTSWVYKTPDRPLMFAQVLPASLSLNGAMLKGATYLGCWPVKLEGALVVTNGFSLAAANPSARDFADLRGMSDAFNDVNGDKAVGGRIGLVFPKLGIWAGLSGLANGAYDRTGKHDISLWDVDFSWHRGNWDFRFELARVDQQVPGSPIDRRGLYAQVAYRPYDCPHRLLSKLEGVLRYDLVQFRGINLAATGIRTPTGGFVFGSRENTPIDRARYTVGLNYWAYPSLVFRVAYEVNEELRFANLKDNGILAQVSWGF